MASGPPRMIARVGIEIFSEVLVENGGLAGQLIPMRSLDPRIAIATQEAEMQPVETDNHCLHGCIMHMMENLRLQPQNGRVESPERF